MQQAPVQTRLSDLLAEHKLGFSVAIAQTNPAMPASFSQHQVHWEASLLCREQLVTTFTASFDLELFGAAPPQDVDLLGFLAADLTELQANPTPEAWLARMKTAPEDPAASRWLWCYEQISLVGDEISAVLGPEVLSAIVSAIDDTVTTRALQPSMA
ncbi:conserved hypothetical protein [Hyphomicrobiales bacterium]|nr:conserved hypothetical protein [Hyphomicrobiales bacterium]CAH1702601.1 conserved hypothetical protein [Hyphomicrobiales bacterium]CAI0346804.1 conserved hypothetical protein [Hyphomicrobiales bacterium]